MTQDALIGRVLDARYRIEDRLGAGGVGVVYRAENTKTRKKVAIKVLSEDLGSVPEVRRRFEREARALRALTHPHVVGITDHGVAEGLPYLVMELLEGRTLEQLIDAGALDPLRGLDLVRQILHGVAFAHARGVMHRDLKPGNVFLQEMHDGKDHVKILDFGLAKLLYDEDGTGEPTLTKAGMILGTPAYMAPEQAAGAKCDLRVDVYSAGVVLFELITGQVPFTAQTRADLLRKHLLAPVPDLEAMRPGLKVVPALRALIERAMEKDRAKRFPDASSMLTAMNALPKDAATVADTQVSRMAPGDVNATTSDETTLPVAMDVEAMDRPSPRMDPTPRLPSLPPAPKKKSGFGRALLGLAAVAVLAAGGVGVAAGMGAFDTRPPPATAISTTGTHPDPATHADPTPRAAAVPAPTASPDPVPEAAPRDPWATGVPPELAPWLERIRNGAELTRDDLAALRRVAAALRPDARGQLVVAYALVDRHAFTDAIARYRVAHELDPTVRGDRRMRDDLLLMAGSRIAGDRAGDAVVEIYGAEALPSLETAIVDEPDPTMRARLIVLRDRLRSLASATPLPN